jgi:hypothetical protein
LPQPLLLQQPFPLPQQQNRMMMSRMIHQQPLPSKHPQFISHISLYYSIWSSTPLALSILHPMIPTKMCAGFTGTEINFIGI